MDRTPARCQVALVEQMIGRRLQVHGPAGEEAAAIKEMAERSGRTVRADAAPLLEAKAVSSARTLQQVSVSVRPGEIVGVGGLVGSGRSELLDAIFGLDRAATGQVLIGGKPIKRSPRWRSSTKC